MKLDADLKARPGLGDVAVYSLTSFFLSCFVAILVTAGLIALRWERAVPFAWALPVLTLLVVAWLTTRLRLELRDDVVRIGGFFSEHEIRTSSIQRVSVTVFYPIMQLETVERRFRVFLVRQALRDTESLKRIRAFFVQHGVETDLSGLSKWGGS